MFYIFQRALHPALFFFLVIKNKPPFSTISKQGKKAGFLTKIMKCYLKDMHLETSCTQKHQILHQNTILFLDGKTFIKRKWWLKLSIDNCTFIWKIKTKMLLNIYLKTVSPSQPQNHLILTINWHFVSSWKIIYWRRWSTFDGGIRIMRRLLQNYARNLTQGFS